MNPLERKFLDKLDNLVLTASPDELKKIQEVDRQNQLNCITFYADFVNSQSMTNKKIKQESRESQK